MTMDGAFNLFQATMLRWRARHPYNAVHVARVDSALDPDRLRAAIAAVLAGAGLTGYRLDAARLRFEWRGGEARVRLAVADAGADAQAAVRATIERLLDHPFPADGEYEPFAFEAVRDGGGFWLALAYDHIVAGGDSAVALLGALVARYAGPMPIAPLDRHPARFRRMIARHPIAAAAAMAGLPRLAWRARRARRAPGLERREAANAFVMASLPGADEKIGVAAKRWGVTRNDVLMAAVIRAVAGLKPPAGPASRRREVAVASVMNIRSECAASVERVFGQFLSSFRASHPDPRGVPLADVARVVHAESRDVRARRRYLRSLAALAVSGFAWRLVGEDRRHSIYAKHYPVWAGLTTIVLPGLWSAMAPSAGARPAAYRRGVSTGPLAPVVVAATFTGTSLELGVSFRPAAVPPDALARTLESLAAELSGIS